MPRKSVAILVLLAVGGAITLSLKYAHVFVVSRSRVAQCYGSIQMTRWLETATPTQRDIFLNNNANEKVARGKRFLWQAAMRDMESKDEVLRPLFDRCLDGEIW